MEAECRQFSVEQTFAEPSCSSPSFLYVYESVERYVERAAAYVRQGLSEGERTLFVDSQERYRRLCRQLSKEERAGIDFVENVGLRWKGGGFTVNSALVWLACVIQPFLAQAAKLRFWGHVEWTAKEKLLRKRAKGAFDCGLSLEAMGTPTVWAYDGRTLPAAQLQLMLRRHPYWMNDTELWQSPLYCNPKQGADQASEMFKDSFEGDGELNRYRQKLDFAHIVMHEVRNPLTVVKSYASLLAEKEEDPDKRQKLDLIGDYAALIDNELSHMLATEQMLSSHSLWHHTRIQPLAVLEEVVELMRVKARLQQQNLKVKLELRREDVMLGNAAGLRLIISNVLSNALKYSNEGQTVTFAAKIREGKLRLKITDEGIGMSREELGRLFRKYEKMHPGRGGQGIGLFMVKKLVDDFGGVIEVKSMPDEGTKVRIELPLRKLAGNG
ncbi:ATP-binding protein [Paenibacillus chartarius]|uniref:histidine kinase n=1 Tax=Paenibacillus chartarius TaxID=747481 RepID=A0ABV6DGG2_9BACL